jgi:hypothetical protein
MAIGSTCHDKPIYLLPKYHGRKRIRERSPPSALLQHGIECLLRQYDKELEEYCNSDLIDHNNSRSPLAM